MADVASGVIWSDTLPAWQRTYFEAVLLETLRIKSILVPFTAVKEDPRARDTGIVTYTEVLDTEPNWNPLTEQTIWLQGAHLDSRSVSINLEPHGDTLKFSDYNEIVSYINNGDLKGLVKDKIGQNMIATLDILARNAFLDHPNKVFAGGTRADRVSITSTDLFDPDLAELARVHLEELNVPGVVATQDGEGAEIVCVTTPRVIHDIRTQAGSKWLSVVQYAQPVKKFTSEVGSWDGVRFVRTNRNVLKNHGAVTHQTTLAVEAKAGDGAAQTVDKVYTPGQSTSTRYVTVVDITGFAVGQYVTIHSQSAGAGAGQPPVESDGTQETRRIVAIDSVNKRLSLEKPCMKTHPVGDFVTFGVDIHASFFMGGPGVVYGIGERPTPVVPPKYDDLMMINRYGWRAFVKFQMFRPEFLECHETAGSSN
jgi:N4-gp56 family major capsid protein